MMHVIISRPLVRSEQKDATMEMSNVQVHSTVLDEGNPLTEEPEEGDSEDHAAVEVEAQHPFSRLDTILSIYVVVIVWSPVFAALFLTIIPVSDDAAFHLHRALTISSCLFVFFILAMARLYRTQQYFFLMAMYWVLLIYVDVVCSLLGILFLPKLLGGKFKADDEESSVISKITVVSITLAAWLILDLIARGGIFRTHDYTLGETMPQEGSDEKLYAILKRGLDENDFRYKYIPKTHVQLMCCVFILTGTILGGIISPTSLAVTLPVAVLCLVDMCYHRYCIDHEDPDESSTTQEDSGAANETTTQQPDEIITPEIV